MLSGSVTTVRKDVKRIRRERNFLGEIFGSFGFQGVSGLNP
jgi:hypothetical protein